MELAKFVPAFYLEQEGATTQPLFGETDEFWKKVARDMIDNGTVEVRMFGSGRRQVAYQMPQFYKITRNLDDSLF